MRPKLRFKGFDEVWEKAPFKKMVTRYSSMGYDESVPSVEYEDINSREGTLNKDIKKKTTHKSGQFFDSGDLLFGKLRPYLGNILLADFKGIAVGDFWVFKNGLTSTNFLYPFLYSSEFSRVSNISSGSKMPRSDWELVSNWIFHYPLQTQEQSAIGSYFKELDEQITATEAKIERLRKVKAASLQAMFPQEGETKPRLRFKGFDDDWRIDVVKNICDTSNGKSNTQDQVEDGSYPFFIRSEKIVKSNQYLYDCEAVITVGDGQIGKIFHYVNGKFDLHQRCYFMSNFRKIDGKFFYYYFSNSFYDRVIRMSAKATVDSVRLEMITNMPIAYPDDNCEQQKIADYFANLDRQISLAEQRLEKLRQIKAACLDNMFV